MENKKHFKKTLSVNEKALLTSYKVSYKKARCKKPHYCRRVYFACAAIEIVETMFGNNFAKELQSIPLSNDTVSRRIDDIAEDVEQQLFDNKPSDNYKIVIHADRTPRGEHEWRCNAMMVNEVAILVTDEPCSPRDIVLRANDNTLQRIADTHKLYDTLQYPLIFSKDEPGYHFNIPVVNPTTGQPISNKKVSCMDFMRIT
ncbi:ATP-dependent DNA helicase [Trichonephila clavipes]|nr:ATP-dependent DNA helicase [Trichonephila clavipes]